MAKNGAPKKTNTRKAKGPAAFTPQAPPAPPVSWPRRLGQEMTALLLVGLAGFLLLALGSHSAQDPQSLAGIWSAPGVGNAAGKAGALLAAQLLWGLGLAAFWLPVLLLGLAWQSHRRGLEELAGTQALAALGLVAASAGLSSLAWPYLAWGGTLIHSGGALGSLLAQGLLAGLNRPGAVLVLALVLLVSLMGATRLSYVALMALLGQMLRAGWRLAWGRGAEALPLPRKVRRAAMEKPVIAGPTATEESLAPAPPPVGAATETAAGKSRRVAAPTPGIFTLPSLDLLDPSPPWNQQVQEGAMLTQAQKLEETLRHFGVEGRVTAIMSGPAVSRFEYEPALGVKISKITGLADDLALALKALSIRIVAPVPGKGVLGIEVPNAKRQVVSLREILADAAYQKSASRLSLALGKDIMGTSVVTDLAKMPHLLIAGATGSGKSVGLNAMILSILFKATPEEVRFLLVDP